MGTDGKCRPHSPIETYWQWCKPTCPAHYHFAAHYHPYDRIVHVTNYRTVVDQKNVGNAGESRKCLVLIHADRLVRQIAASCDNRKAKLFHQQMMQRRVWQHCADIW